MQRARDLLASHVILLCVWRFCMKEKWTWIVPIWSGESVVFEYLTLLLKPVLLSMQANDWLTAALPHVRPQMEEIVLSWLFCLQVGDLKRSVCFLGELGCYRAWIQEALRKEILSSPRIWVAAVEVRFHACPNFIEIVTSLVGCLQASRIPPIAEGLSKVFFP